MEKKETIYCYNSNRELRGKTITFIKHIEPNETLHFTAIGIGSNDEGLSCRPKLKVNMIENDS